MSNAEEIRRLQWRCRRGLLELDVLLGRFLANHYENLAPSEQEVFSALLERSDQDLIDWLLLGKPAPEVFATLVGAIGLSSLRSG